MFVKYFWIQKKGCRISLPQPYVYVTVLTTIRTGLHSQSYKDVEDLIIISYVIEVVKSYYIRCLRECQIIGIHFWSSSFQKCGIFGVGIGGSQHQVFLFNDERCIGL